MASSRALKTLITAFSAVSAEVIAVSIYLFLQHEAVMRQMMGGVMPGMMWMPWLSPRSSPWRFLYQ